MTLSDGPWMASAAHPDTKAHTITNAQGRVVAALVPSKDDAEFIVQARMKTAQAHAEALVAAMQQEVKKKYRKGLYMSVTAFRVTYGGRVYHIGVHEDD